MKNRHYGEFDIDSSTSETVSYELWKTNEGIEGHIELPCRLDIKYLKGLIRAIEEAEKEASGHVNMFNDMKKLQDWNLEAIKGMKPLSREQKIMQRLIN